MLIISWLLLAFTPSHGCGLHSDQGWLAEYQDGFGIIAHLLGPFVRSLAGGGICGQSGTLYVSLGTLPFCGGLRFQTPGGGSRPIIYVAGWLSLHPRAHLLRVFVGFREIFAAPFEYGCPECTSSITKRSRPTPHAAQSRPDAEITCCDSPRRWNMLCGRYCRQ